MRNETDFVISVTDSSNKNLLHSGKQHFSKHRPTLHKIRVGKGTPKATFI